MVNFLRVDRSECLGMMLKTQWYLPIYTGFTCYMYDLSLKTPLLVGLILWWKIILNFWITWEILLIGKSHMILLCDHVIFELSCDDYVMLQLLLVCLYVTSFSCYWRIFFCDTVSHMTVMCFLYTGVWRLSKIISSPEFLRYNSQQMK